MSDPGRATPYRVRPIGTCSRCGALVYPPYILTHACGAKGSERPVSATTNARVANPASPARGQESRASDICLTPHGGDPAACKACGYPGMAV